MSTTQLPKLVFFSEESALIECPYMAVTGQTEEQAAELSEKICVLCGYWRDSQVREQDLHLKYRGEKRFSLLCFNVASPYLAEAKKKLRETGLP